MRFVVSLVALALAATLAAPAFAQEGPASDQDQPTSVASGPVLQPVNLAPVVCDPATAGFRYLEVRGSGFDAWSSQRLVGSLTDASGAAQAHWPNVWVTPRGRLTLELNLCAEPLQNRPALGPGDYTLAVGQANGAPIAATGISLAAPAVPGMQDDQGAPPAATSPEPTPLPAPRSGPGSIQQSIPLGNQATLADNWQLVVANVAPDAYGTIHAAIPSATAPAAAHQDVMIGIQATYVGPATGTFTAVRLALLNPQTQATYNQLNNGCGAIPSAVSPNVVTPGTVVVGNVCFNVASSDVGSLLVFDNQPSPADRTYFALQ